MVKNNLFEEKTAWIRIIEATIVVIVIMGILLIIVGDEYLIRNDESYKIYEKESHILDVIQKNDTFRDKIINAESVAEKEANALFIEEAIEDFISGNLVCEVKICDIGESCVMNNSSASEIYSQKRIIFTNLNTYNPKRIQLFCWEL